MRKKTYITLFTYVFVMLSFHINTYFVIENNELIDVSEEEFDDLANSTTSQANDQLYEENTFVDFSGGENITLTLDKEGNLYCSGIGTYGACGARNRSAAISIPELVSFNHGKIVQAIPSNESVIVRTEHGEVYVWGRNSNGLLGPSQNNNGGSVTTPIKITGFSGTPIAIASGLFTFALITDNGSVYTWGLNYEGSLG